MVQMLGGLAVLGIDATQQRDVQFLIQLRRAVGIPDTSDSGGLASMHWAISNNAFQSSGYAEISWRLEGKQVKVKAPLSPSGSLLERDHPVVASLCHDAVSCFPLE